MNDWFSVNDKLPKQNDIVLCYREYDDWYVVTDYIDGSFWIDFSDNNIAHAITDWQYLTKPAKD